MASIRFREYWTLAYFFILILCPPATAGINFGSSGSSAIEVVENGVGLLETGVKHYAKIYWCTAVIVEGKYLIHIYPMGHLNQKVNHYNYLYKLFKRIHADDKVVVVTSERRDSEYPELISFEQIMYILRLQTGNITVYPKTSEAKMVIADKDGWEVKLINNGAGFMCSSVPINHKMN